ncbi:MAG TPA: hypothetical protein VFY88_00795, partial [Intrasporangium sp.]|nr:hypothetical protein [Intrasporangium sp.]
TPSAVTIAMPTLRYDPTELQSWLRELRITVADVRDALAREVSAMRLTGAPAAEAARQPPTDG